MNVIISKLDLPCDMKNIIQDYLYDENGFTRDQLVSIQQAKKEKEFMMLRIKLELWEWQRVDKSIRWLRNGGVYNIDGLDGPYGYELAVFNEVYLEGSLFNGLPRPETAELRKAQGTVRKYQARVYVKQAQERLRQIKLYGHTL